MHAYVVLALAYMIMTPSAVEQVNPPTCKPPATDRGGRPGAGESLRRLGP